MIAEVKSTRSIRLNMVGTSSTLLTQQMVAVRFGVTRSRITQEEERAIHKLRVGLREMFGDRFMEEAARA